MAIGNGLPTPSRVSAGPQYGIPEVLGYGAIFAVQAIAQSACVAQEYTFGAHAEATYNAEAVKSQVWHAQPAPPAPPPVVIQPSQVWTRQDDVLAQAESYKTQIRGLFPGSIGQGFVSSLQVADEQESYQPAPSFSVVFGAAPPVPRQISAYFAGPQTVDLTQQPSIAHSVAKPAPVILTGPNIRQFFSGAQVIDYTQQPWIGKSVVIPATIYQLGICFTVNIPIRPFAAPISLRNFSVSFFC
jgi:hypothetical protein